MNRNSEIQRHTVRNERGVSVIEVLVSAVLFTIIAGSVFQSTRISEEAMNRSRSNTLATQLATVVMEQFTAMDPETLDSDDSYSDQVVFGGMNFTRNVTVTINSDRTRRVEIKVYGDNQHLGGYAHLENSFALWGTR